MPTATIDEQLQEVRAALEPARRDAQTKWTAFEAKRQEVLESGVSVTEATDESTEAFQALDGVHREYQEAAEKYAQLSDRERSLGAMTSTKGLPRDVREAVEAHREGEAVSWGSRMTASEVYTQGVDSGQFSASGDAKFGRVALGQIANQQEFFALVRGEDSDGVSLDPVVRRPGIVAAPDRPLRLVDLITVSQSDSDSIDMIVETGFTNNAAPVPEAETEAVINGTTVTAAEGGLKPLSALQLEVVKKAAVTIAHAIPTTRRAFRNKAQVASHVDNRLRFGLADTLDTQIAAGSGSGENFEGIQNAPGISSQVYDDEATRGAYDAMLLALRKAMTKTAIAGYPATAVGMDPEDAEGIRLTRDDNGQFLFGPPAQAGDQTVWGRQIAESVAFITGQPMVGDFRQAELYIVSGVIVLVSDSHADWFLRNILAILAEFDAIFGVVAPKAFCEVVPDTP